MGVHIGSAAAAGEVHEVIIPDGKTEFVPAIVTIATGDTVRWVNQDTTQESHDFASFQGIKPENKELKTVVLESGKTFEHTFNTPGEYKYLCYIHRGMIGMVVVK